MVDIPLSPPPVGDVSRRPSPGYVVIPRSPEIDAEEERLSRALVATVGGCRPVVTAEQVSQYLLAPYDIPATRFSVHGYQPEDFLLMFEEVADFDRAFRGPPPPSTPFQQIWKRWSRLSVASPKDLRFRVLLVLSGIPAHTWSLDSAQPILGSSCAKLEPTEDTVNRTDLKHFVVADWRVHPDLIPCVRTLLLPEPKLPHDPGNLFLKEHELIHSKLSLLTYCVAVCLLEWQDRTPRDDDDNGMLPDNWD
ncbi:hypothetical protein BS78_01G089600 [Paspalum vaginatum]|nr:hypothetical protein BS78_01G089600 [Paspalum vaginatum]